MTSDSETNAYQPSLAATEIDRIRRWHESAYQGLRKSDQRHFSYMGREFEVPQNVIPPAPVNELLWNAILETVQPNDRVLDMGTGSGINGVLAASISSDVVGVDINPDAVECASANARRNGVESHTSFFESDVFSRVDGVFDVIIFDPPFRWFIPRDIFEASMADENYGALTRFMNEAARYLRDGGSVLMFFGTSGDIEYLYALSEETAWKREVISERSLEKDDVTVSYYAYRFTRDPESKAALQ